MEIFFVRAIILFLMVHGGSQVLGDFKTGADVLCASPGKYLKGKEHPYFSKIGILCNAASVIASGESTEHLVDALYSRSQSDQTFEIAAIFAPEHGFDGKKEAFADVAHAKHPKIGCPIYSLHYGNVRRPKPEMFNGLDQAIVDLPDVGVRCYTYIATMVNMLEAAAAAKVPVVLLDRPNPIKDWKVSGNEFDAKYRSFVAKVNIPFLHGMTMGDIAKIVAKDTGCKLTVIKTKGSQTEALRYLRHYFVPPSPNLSSLHKIFCYPMLVCLEGTNYSEGRGTDLVFEQFGAPWVDGELLAKNLNEQQIPGVIFEATLFTPQSNEGALKPKHKGKLCGGVILKLSDRATVDPLQVSTALMTTLFKLYPVQSKWIPSIKYTYFVDQLMAGSQWRESVMKDAVGEGKRETSK